MKSSADFGSHFKLEGKFSFEYHNHHLVGLLLVKRWINATYRSNKTFYDPITNEREKVASGR